MPQRLVLPLLFLFTVPATCSSAIYHSHTSLSGNHSLTLDLVALQLSSTSWPRPPNSGLVATPDLRLAILEGVIFTSNLVDRSLPLQPLSRREFRPLPPASIESAHSASLANCRHRRLRHHSSIPTHQRAKCPAHHRRQRYSLSHQTTGNNSTTTLLSLTLTIACSGQVKPLPAAEVPFAH